MTAKIKHIRIEKYDIEAFKKEQKPYALILNEVIQRCPMNHSNEFLLWCFLESLPDTWEPNKAHITSYFKISDRTYERYMSWLNAVGLIEYRQQRNKDGTFGKWELIVLSGTQFNPDAVSNRSAKIGGSEIHRIKKAKVIHISPDRSANFGGTDESPTTQAQPDESSNSPFRQKTVERSNGAHINTRAFKTKAKEKTNNPVSVFSCAVSVKTHIEMVVANRKSQSLPSDDIVNQGIYYAYETNSDKSFDSVNKRINIFLKKVRENKWLIPQGYQNISSQAIAKQESEQQRQKEIQQQYDAKFVRQIRKAVLTNTGAQALNSLLKHLA